MQIWTGLTVVDPPNGVQSLALALVHMLMLLSCFLPWFGDFDSPLSDTFPIKSATYVFFFHRQTNLCVSVITVLKHFGFHVCTSVTSFMREKFHRNWRFCIQIFYPRSGCSHGALNSVFRPNPLMYLALTICFFLLSQCALASILSFRLDDH